MLKEFAELRAERSKFAGVERIAERLESLDNQLADQARRLDQVQVKVNLSCETLSRVQQEEIGAARSGRIPRNREPWWACWVLHRHLSHAIHNLQEERDTSFRAVGNWHPCCNRRSWQGGGTRHPKWIFPKLDGTGVRIWLDQCESFSSYTTSLKISR